jgi:hypothetical protein
MLLPAFGEEMTTIVIRCIGMPGGNCVTQRTRVVWGLETSTPLTLLCWLNKFGGLLLIETRYVQRCSVLIFS